MTDVGLTPPLVPDSPDSEMQVVEYLRDLMGQANSETLRSHEEADYFYDKGTYGEFSSEGTAPVTGILRRNRFPSLSRRLINMAIPSLVSWSMDERSVVLSMRGMRGEDGVVEELTDVPDGVTDEWERVFRESLPHSTVKEFWRLLLLYGRVGVHYSDTHGLLLAGGGAVSHSTNASIMTVDMPVDTMDPDGEDARVMIANYTDGNGDMWEVVAPEDEGSEMEAVFEPLERRTLLTMDYSEVSDGSPVGVPGVLRALEIEYSVVRDALESRTKRVANASMIVNSQILDRAVKGETLYEQNIIGVDNDVSDDAIKMVPTNAEDILHLHSREDRIINEAMMITGLHDPRPSQGADGRTATESLVEYESKTARHRELQDMWVGIYAEIIELVADLSHNLLVEATKAQSPLDGQRRLEGVEKILAHAKDIAATDPTGAVYGMDSAAMVRAMLSQVASEHKLDRTVFDQKWPTSSGDEQERMRVMQQQDAEAQSRITAADTAARGQEMAGEAALLNARTKAEMSRADLRVRVNESIREGRVQDHRMELEQFKARSEVRMAEKKVTLSVADLLRQMRETGATGPGTGEAAALIAQRLDLAADKEVDASLEGGGGDDGEA